MRQLITRGLESTAALWPDIARAYGWVHRAAHILNNRGEENARLVQRRFDGLVAAMEGFWSLLRSWLRPHRGISQDKLPLYLGFFQFVHNARRRGRALLSALIAGLVA